MAIQATPLISRLVHANQSAFLTGRSIVDNFVMVQQSIRTLHRRNVASIMLKLDVAKAFDSLDWPFLLKLHQHRGFGPKWIARLATLLSTASTKVLINGLPRQVFTCSWFEAGRPPIAPSLRPGDGCYDNANQERRVLTVVWIVCSLGY